MVNLVEGLEEMAGRHSEKDESGQEGGDCRG